jgi:hypothetical protein
MASSNADSSSEPSGAPADLVLGAAGLLCALARPALVFVCLLALTPLGAAAFDLARAAAGGRASDLLRAFTAMGHGATVSTILAALAAGAGASAGGYFIAPIFAARPRARAARAARLLLAAAVLAPLALPPVVLGGLISELLRVGPAPLPGAAPTLGRWAALSATWALAFAPLAALIVHAAGLAAPALEMKAARALLAPRGRLRAVILPRVVPPLGLLAAAVAALAASDLVTPPHFGVETLASRVAWDFSTTLDGPRCEAAYLVPWLAMALGFAALAPSAAPRRGQDGGESVRASWVAATAFALLTTVAPAALLIGRHGALEGGFSELLARLGRDARETALAVCAGAAASTATFLILAARRFHEADRGPSAWTGRFAAA